MLAKKRSMILELDGVPEVPRYGTRYKLPMVPVTVIKKYRVQYRVLKYRGTAHHCNYPNSITSISFKKIFAVAHPLRNKTIFDATCE